MKTKNKVVSLVLVAVLLVTSVFAFASCGGDDEKVIYIGASGPLTGGAAVYGLAVQNSAQMAVDEINAMADNGLDGYTLKFVMYDDKHDATNVATNFSTMYEAGMKVSLGCVTTGPCKEFKTLSNEENVFFMTPSASADTIVEFDNAYQMCFADSKQGVAAANYVNGLGKTKVGVLYKSDDAYSTGIYNEFKNTLDKNITLIEASFTGETVTSFASQITTLKSCDFIFMPIYCAPAAQFMTEAKTDVAANAVYYGCDGLDGIDTFSATFDISTIPQEVSFLSHYNSTATSGKAKEFADKYKAAYGAETLNQFGASAYDCVFAIYNAIKEAKADGLKLNADASAYCEALKAVFQGGFSYTGVTGVEGTAITWDKDGFAQKSAIKYVVKAANAPQ